MAMLSQVVDDSFCSGIFIPKPVHKVNTVLKRRQLTFESIGTISA